ncbi:hypothetical protein SAMN05444405_1015 [Bacteroides luti]|uniref:Uncharacterized protein n=1 Tax=Bacteroides luti TaxID=1297750 RepID=A0A1M4S6X6_9BACE|nr:hypothetical protein SAMN05444405_1015 [Bacteroides luti]
MIFARILFKHKETFKIPCTKQLILLYKRKQSFVQDIFYHSKYLLEI